jgi:NAD(P)-dependent dehydrogenase (short-subunit alcohol dehydrogenase family)
MTTAAPDVAAKTALVTGANRGMGLGYARHYLADGWTVLATSRDPLATSELTSLSQQHPDRLRVLPLDLANESSIEALRKKLHAEGIRLDLLINNAAVAQECGFGDWKADTFHHHFTVNVLGPALLTQALAPFFNQGAIIVNISSGLGSLELNIAPEDPEDAYAMSKAALNMLTRRLAAKMKSQQVTVISINPGWVKTAMGGPGASDTVDETVANIAQTISSLDLNHTGTFIGSNGAQVPW